MLISLGNIEFGAWDILHILGKFWLLILNMPSVFLRQFWLLRYDIPSLNDMRITGLQIIIIFLFNKIVSYM